MTVSAGDLVPGFSLPPLTRTITVEQIVSSSRGRESLWGLPPAGKNIHNDTETARSIGARDVVAGGVVTMGLGWEMLLDAFRGAVAEGRATVVHFRQHGVRRG